MKRAFLSFNAYIITAEKGKKKNTGIDVRIFQKLLVKRACFSSIFLVLIVVFLPSSLGSKLVCLDRA
jgi:hypothetical protein